MERKERSVASVHDARRETNDGDVTSIRPGDMLLWCADWDNMTVLVLSVTGDDDVDVTYRGDDSVDVTYRGDDSKDKMLIVWNHNGTSRLDVVWGRHAWRLWHFDSIVRDGHVFNVHPSVRSP